MLGFSRLSFSFRNLRIESNTPSLSTNPRRTPQQQNPFTRVHTPLILPKTSTPFFRKITVELKPITGLPINTPITYEHVIPELRPHINFSSSEKVGTVSLSSEVFKSPIRKDILHRVVKWQLSKRRQGTASAKSRSEVSGGGKKPWKQKGTGRARAGTTRAPHWRHGGVAFPPKPRSYDYPLPKKVRKMGVRIALSTKYAEGKLVVCESLKGIEKTKEMQKIVDSKGWKSALLVDDEIASEMLRSTQNLYKVDILPQIGVNVYDLLRNDTLVLTKSAAEKLQARLL